MIADLRSDIWTHDLLKSKQIANNPTVTLCNTNKFCEYNKTALLRAEFQFYFIVLELQSRMEVIMRVWNGFNTMRLIKRPNVAIELISLGETAEKDESHILKSCTSNRLLRNYVRLKNHSRSGTKNCSKKKNPQNLINKSWNVTLTVIDNQ